MVILFDLFNTLVASRDEARDGVTRAMATELGVDPEEYRNLFVSQWPQRLLGTCGDLERTVSEPALLLGGSPSAEDIARAVARRVELTRASMRPSADTLAALDRLRAAGHRLGVVSNCTVETELIWPETPLASRFDTVAFSCVLGVGKPDPRIYLTACGALDAEPERCVYVGDGADYELRGAVAVGMRAIQTTEYARSDPSWQGARVDRLADLPDLLLPRLTGRRV